jgi:hypothetical protein
MEHFARQARIGNRDKGYPMQAGLLGTVAAMPAAYFVTRPVEQPWRRGNPGRILFVPDPLPE